MFFTLKIVRFASLCLREHDLSSYKTSYKTVIFSTLISSFKFFKFELFTISSCSINSWLVIHDVWFKQCICFDNAIICTSEIEKTSWKSWKAITSSTYNTIFVKKMKITFRCLKMLKRRIRSYCSKRTTTDWKSFYNQETNKNKNTCRNFCMQTLLDQIFKQHSASQTYWRTSCQEVEDYIWDFYISSKSQNIKLVVFESFFDDVTFSSDIESNIYRINFNYIFRYICNVIANYMSSNSSQININFIFNIFVKFAANIDSFTCYIKQIKHVLHDYRWFVCHVRRKTIQKKREHHNKQDIFFRFSSNANH